MAKENQREFYRLEFYDVQVLIVFYEHGNHQEERGKILDLSANGMRFRVERPLQFDNCVVSFTLLDQAFAFRAKFVRKDQPDVYGVTFVGLDEKTQSSIVSRLMKIEAKRKN